MTQSSSRTLLCCLTPRRTPIRPSTILHHQRRHESTSTSGDDPSSEAPESDAPARRDFPMTRQEWLDGPGAKYREPRHGSPNWLGETPFPTNPSFKPATPLTNALKDRIFVAFKALSANSNSRPEMAIVRELATKHSLSKERVAAVIRLKALEEQWKKDGKPLQTDCEKGMLGVMGVVEHSLAQKEFQPGVRIGRKSVYDFVDPDEVVSTESQQADSKERKQAIPEGESTIIPPDAPGRPAFHFVDVPGAGTPRRVIRSVSGNRKKYGYVDSHELARKGRAASSVDEN